ncbi:MAG: hypothetical protein GY870_16535 [archaeon]|nr:hypothetical protein [archaeon]
MVIKIYTDKRKQCYNKNGRYHNEYGPDEINSKGYKSYCRYGFYHNVRGYAVIYSDGHKDVYYLNGIHYTEQHEWEIRTMKYKK